MTLGGVAVLTELSLCPGQGAGPIHMCMPLSSRDHVQYARSIDPHLKPARARAQRRRARCRTRRACPRLGIARQALARGRSPTLLLRFPAVRFVRNCAIAHALKPVDVPRTAETRGAGRGARARARQAGA